MIDGGIFIDRDPTSGRGGEAADAIARLDRFGIDHALAASFKAVYFDEREGNSLTADICTGSGGRLSPLAVVNLIGYDLHADRLREIAEGPFVAAALFPAPQNWSWADYVTEVFARECAALNFPIQAGVWGRQDLAAVARHVAPAGGDVLIRWMGRSGYNNIADMIAVAHDHQNIVFDISTVTQSGGIEHLAERIGADRLYCASSAPLAAEGAPYFMLEGARLSEADRMAIRRGTLSRVLKIDPPTHPAPAPSAWEALRDTPKVDTHWHTSGWNIIEPRISFAQISEDFDALGYRIAISNSIRALNHEIVEGNAETRAFLDAEPRARGLVVINPLEIATSISELAKYRGDPRFVGVKTIQDFYGKDLDDPGYLEILDALDDKPDWPIMAHLPGMDRLARARPHLNFIAAHATWRYWDFADLENVWFDIATSTADHHDANIRAMVETVGEDRVIFSCDGQLMNPAWTLGKLASAGLPDTAMRKILQENAFKAFPRLRETAEPPA
jgi:hypothetical protein